MVERKLKPKKCKVCGGEFNPLSSTQRVCSYVCSLNKVRSDKEAQRSKDHRRAKEVYRNNDRPYQLKKTQAAINAFVRERDKGKPCISCGRHHEGQYHAGHYRSVGAAPHLRFNSLNIQRQCAPCNNHKSGNAIEYRMGLVDRYGVELVERLESANGPVKFSLDDIKAIGAYYRRLKKAIETE